MQFEDFAVGGICTIALILKRENLQVGKVDPVPAQVGRALNCKSQFNLDSLKVEAHSFLSQEVAKVSY